jgi:hypothetical protein
MSCAASRFGKAVASSGTRATAPPWVKIGIVDSGEVIRAACVVTMSITSSVSGPSLCDFQ